jgi:hypothetical protein
MPITHSCHLTLALAALALLATPAAAATKPVVRGTLSRWPTPARNVLGAVTAIDADSGAIVGTAAAPKGHYRLALPTGTYILIGRASDLRRGRARFLSSNVVALGKRGQTVDLPGDPPLKAKRPAPRSIARAATAGGSGGSVGIGGIPVTTATGSGMHGGNAIDPLVQGLLPQCQKSDEKLIDISKQVTEARRREQQFSDDGRTETRLTVDESQPDRIVTGKVTVDADGKPVVDITITDGKTGAIIDHVRTAGDKDSSIDDVGDLLRRVGKGVGQRDCKPDPPPPAAARATRPGQSGPGAQGARHDAAGRDALRADHHHLLRLRGRHQHAVQRRGRADLPRRLVRVAHRDARRVGGRRDAVGVLAAQRHDQLGPERRPLLQRDAEPTGRARPVLQHDDGLPAPAQGHRPQDVARPDRRRPGMGHVPGLQRHDRRQRLLVLPRVLLRATSSPPAAGRRVHAAVVRRLGAERRPARRPVGHAPRQLPAHLQLGLRRRWPDLHAGRQPPERHHAVEGLSLKTPRARADCNEHMTHLSVVALGVCSAFLIAAPATQAGGLTTTFDETGAEQAYTVPAATTRIHVRAVGAGGFQNGGAGAVVDTDLPVTPGETLYVEVGDNHGWNGGGQGYFGAGGGASDVRTTSISGDPATSLASRLVVAGGGGAGSLDFAGGSGGLVPSAGGGPLAGQPATASAGGAPAGGAGAGALGQGGDGELHGGSGGGGYYGGGGAGGNAQNGTDSGGGAGSNHVAPDALDTSITTNTGQPNGKVTITTGPATVVADAPVTFGSRAIGTVGAHQLTLVDTGFGPFETTGDATISGPGALDYILGSTTCIGWVATCRIPVLFSPTTIGERTATLTVYTSDDAGSLEVPLSGTGIAAADDTDHADDAPASITYVTQVLTPAPASATAPALPAPAPVPASAKPMTAAKMVLATCHAGRSQGKPALRCRLVSVPAGATLPAKSRLTATLTNRSARYATGTARTIKGVTQLLLTPSRHIAFGRYSTLTLSAHGHKTVRTAVVMG